MLESPAPTDSRGERLDSFRLDPFGASRHRIPGVTAVVRLDGVRTALDHGLPPLLRAVDKVIVVDQETAAGHAHHRRADRARDIAATLGLADRLTVLDYPFELSPPGPTHLATPPDSVHSLVHVHNWAFSHVRTTYALRWDPSLVLTPGGEALVADFGWQVGHHHVALRLPRHPLYVESDRVAYLDLAWANVEHRGHPAASGYSYVKGFERELLQFPEHTRAYTLPSGSCLLLRDLGDLPAPTSATEPRSSASAEARRERYDADTVRAIRAGRWQDRRALHRLEAPAGWHVVDHAAAYWSGR